ncbi:hypothetical protein M0802_014200 [Mischocyttarus mexicanus]|nr:hypothetical protein M0802_014200 [Mischocyttarus mexicanus]
MSKHFNNSNTLRILYCQLVRYILEYGNITWSPYYITHSYDIERVQHKFLRLAAKHCGHPMPFDCHNYDSILDRMSLSTLTTIVLLTACFLMKGIKELQKALQESERNQEREMKDWKRRWREMEERIKRVEESRKKGSEQNLQEKFNEMKEKIGEVTEKRIGTEIGKMERIIEKQDKLEKINNVVIRGVELWEEDWRKQVDQLFVNKLGLGEKRRVKWARVIGGVKKVIVAGLESWETKQEVMRNKSKLVGSAIYIDNDLTIKEREIQRNLVEMVRKEVRKGNRVRISKEPAEQQ